MPTPTIKTRYRRRPLTPTAVRSPRTGSVVQTPSAPPPGPHAGTLKAPADATWQTIVEQLLATPSDHEPYTAHPDTEYAWARRLGMHINRPPRHR